MWGLHLSIDARGSARSVARVRDAERLASFSREVVRRIGMVPYGPPLIEYFGKNDAQAAGFTLVQLIETSSIVGHFSDETGDAYLDVFSCRPFDPDAVAELVTRYFQPSEMVLRIISRDAQAGEPGEVVTRKRLPQA